MTNEAETTSQPKCEDLIEDRMAGRLEQFAPDFETMTAEKCRELLEEYGRDMPDCNPWAMERAHVVEALEGLGVACYDEESDDLLREALLESCTSGDWGDVEQWREAARECHQETAHEGVLSVETVKTYRVVIGTGGPHDEFQLDWDGEDWTGGRYVYQDWFDGAKRDIDADQARAVAESVGIYPECEEE